LLAALLGCSPMLPMANTAGLGPAKGDAVTANPETHGLAEREHLLFRPRGNPEELLGRAVTFTPDRKLTIADELSPGCAVRARHTPERWTRKYQDELKSAVAAGAEFGEIAQLEGKYGAEARVEVSIRNVERLDADLEGDCGERLITSVRVGTGSRFVGSRAMQEGKGGLAAMGAGVKASAAQTEDRATEFTWDEPQAWVFTISPGRRTRRMELNAAMPLELTDGQPYRITVIPNQAVWLLVYYREESGQVGKLLPDEENQVVAVAPQERRELPEMRAALNDPAQGVRETMVVCGFDDQEYVNQFAPPKGDPSPAQMTEWSKALPERLSALKNRHYRCENIGYRIVPAPRALP